MSTPRYDVVFRGQIMDGCDLAQVRNQIGHIFNASAAQLEQLFSGHPAVLKRNVEAEVANKMRMVFRKAGAIVELRTCEVSESVTKITEWTITSPNTGSLEDCAIEPTSVPIPNIEHLTMATVGAQIDRTPPPQPINISTTALKLVPGQTWDLQDCYIPPQHLIMPNTQNLTLANPGINLDDSKPPLPPRINTNSIAIVADPNWNLKDCQSPPPPPLIVNLNGLTLTE